MNGNVKEKVVIITYIYWMLTSGQVPYIFLRGLFYFYNNHVRWVLLTKEVKYVKLFSTKWENQNLRVSLVLKFIFLTYIVWLHSRANEIMGERNLVLKEVVCYFLILSLLFTYFIPSLSEQFSQKASASAIHLTHLFDSQSILLPDQSEEGALKHCGVPLMVFGAWAW